LFRAQLSHAMFLHPRSEFLWPRLRHSSCTQKYTSKHTQTQTFTQFQGLEWPEHLATSNNCLFLPWKHRSLHVKSYYQSVRGDSVRASNFSSFFPSLFRLSSRIIKQKEGCKRGRQKKKSENYSCIEKEWKGKLGDERTVLHGWWFLSPSVSQCYLARICNIWKLLWCCT
jgi:hypothetical protein